MSKKKTHLVAVTFKLHPRLIEGLDQYVDNIVFRSRAHIMNVALSEWLERQKTFERNALAKKRASKKAEQKK